MALNFKLCLLDKGYDQKPDKKEMAEMSKRIANCEITISLPRFIEALGAGRPFTGGIFKEGRRRAKNWLEQTVFAADIDDRNMPLSRIMYLSEKFDMNPAIIHETFSSKEDFKKWRVIFIHDYPITDPIIAYAILRKINYHYGGDNSVVDLSRILQGTTPDKIHYVETKTFDVQDVEIEPYIVKPKKQVELEKLAQTFDECVTPDMERARLAFMKAEQLMNSGASRYERLWGATRILVQSGAIVEADIQMCLDQLMQVHPEEWANWDKSPEEVISTAKDWGRRHVIV